MSSIFCGGVSTTPLETSMDLNLSRVYRYGARGPNSMHTVPLRSLEEMVPPGYYVVAKIDTDSIDCTVLAKLWQMSKSHMWIFHAYILERHSSNCQKTSADGVAGVARVLVEMQQANYTV